MVGFAGGEIEKVRPYIRIYTRYLLSVQLPLNLVLLKNISIVGIHWGAYTSEYRFLIQLALIDKFSCRVRPEGNSWCMEGSLRVIHPFLSATIDKAPDYFSFSLFESKKLKPIVYGRTFRLEELPKGLEALEKRETYGKTVIQIREDSERTRL